MRFHALRMGLCAVAAFLPVVLTASYGITLENGSRDEVPSAATDVLPRIEPVALAQPPQTLAALPVKLAAAPQSSALPAVATTAPSAGRHQATASHDPKKRPHHAG